MNLLKSWIVFIAIWTLCSTMPAFISNKIYTSQYLEVYSSQTLSPSLGKIVEALNLRIADLQMEMGIYPEKKVPIHIVSSKAEYQTLAFGKTDIVEFSDAFFSGSDGKIYIRSGDQILDNYLKILMHEYLHWYLEQIFTQTPLWFHEGMATFKSGQIGYERYVMYLRESFMGKKSDLFRMGFSYPSKSEDWQLFYLSSAMAVRYMQDKYPTEWKRFWDITAMNLRNGQKSRFDTTFIYAYNSSLYDFNKRYESYSRKQSYLYLAVAINSAIFLTLPFIMLIISRKRKRLMQKLPDLEEVELVDEDELSINEESKET